MPRREALVAWCLGFVLLSVGAALAPHDLNYWDYLLLVLAGIGMGYGIAESGR
jgi:hypothetical protein